MILESIHLRGFKSFEGPIKILFKKGISAIVGPNGCGKSNIADAIRWVLGEQSARLLRGRNMEDVIFNGSSERKPLGMVEVTLELTNEGTLPVDYHQIRITRRLFRSGESVYLLNKSPCRLKDISNLFINCGLGKNSYFCIEQGNIGFIITAKPVERRILIETSAGILKFKEQKKEAIKKIDNARENLVRLNDIKGEVENQYSHLKSQADLARIYKDLMNQTDRDEQELFILQYKILQYNQNHIDDRLTKLNDKEIGLQATASKQEAELEQKRLLLAQKEIELSDLQQVCWSLEKEIAQKREQIASKDKECLFRKESVDKYRNELESLRIKKKDLEKRLNTLEGVSSENREQLAHQQKQHHFFKEKLKQIQGDRGRIKHELERERKILSSTSSQIGIMKNNQNHLFAKKNDIHKQYSYTIQQIESILASILSLKEKCDLLCESESSIEATISQREQEIAALKEETATGEKRMEELKLKREKTTIELERLKTKKEHLSEMDKSMEGFGDSVKRLFSSSQSKLLRDVVATIIETDPDYEIAVESALGPCLEHMLVDSYEHGLSLIKYLQERKIGRGTFIPLDLSSEFGMRTQNGAIDHILKQPGVLGWIVDFIRYPKQYHAIIMYLLGDLILTKDIESSVNLLKEADRLEEPKDYFRMVTLGGDLIVSNGVVSGGGENSKASGFLKRKRELKEARQQTVVCEEKLLHIKNKHDVEKKRFLSLQGELRSLAEKKQELDTQKKDINREIHYVRTEIARQRKHEERLCLEKEARLSEHEEIDEVIKKEADRIKKLEKEEQDVTLTIDKMARENAALDREYQSINKNFLENKVLLTTVEERIKAIKQEGTLLSQNLQEINEKEIKDQNSIKELTGQISVLTKAREFLAEELPKVIKEFEDKGEKRKQIDSQSARLREELGILNESLRSHRHNFDRIRRAKQKNEIIHAQNKIQIKQLLPLIHQELPDHIEHVDMDQLEKKTEELHEKLTAAKEKLSSMGYVNMGAIEEFEKCSERLSFLNQQQEDLEASITSLTTIIKEINATSEKLFLEAFHKVNENFKILFNRLFEGGEAELTLEDDSNLLETGIEISAKAPGKRRQDITLMSGGEKALTAFALMMALYQLKPSPFCILDEADAALDEVNVERFINLLRETKDKTQFIVVTHSRKTIMAADVLYGITMGTPGVSKVIPVQLDRFHEYQPLNSYSAFN
ncbi:MAG: chromosome segregation protein SMC [bacterium]